MKYNLFVFVHPFDSKDVNLNILMQKYQEQTIFQEIRESKMTLVNYKGDEKNEKRLVFCFDTHRVLISGLPES